MRDISQDKFDIVYYLTNENNGLAFFYEGGEKISLFKYQQCYVKQIEPQFPNMVCTQSMYDKRTLLLKEKGFYLKHGGVIIGLWEYYNEEGELDHVINADEHFPITWGNMEQILKDKDISLLSADSIFRNYDEEKDTATWSITIRLAWDKGCLYVFDGRTGELIKEEIIDMSYE